MTDFKSRVERVEKEYRFRRWFHFQRYLESLNSDQLLSFARHGFCEDPQPKPLPPGASQLDGLDRKRLIELWQDDERRHARFAARSSEDQEFFCVHGHWPEQACGSECVITEERELEIRGNSGANNVFPKQV